MYTLLMTGTIKPIVDVVHNDPQTRLNEYIQTIKKYICESDFTDIVFAENSGYLFDADSLKQLARINGKKFEYLDVSSSADGRNMSTGEAILMKEALDKSQILSQTDYIWKCTGRIFIKNINNILSHDYKDNVFLYSKSYDSMQTWFFGIKKTDLKFLLSDEIIESMSKDCIEYTWMKYYRMNKERLKIVPFKLYPNADGVASSGRAYTMSNFKWVMKNLVNKFGYFTVR